MKAQSALKDIERGIVDLVTSDEMKARVEKAVDAKASPMDVVRSVRKALEDVGERYEKKEYFLMELIVAGNLATEVMNTLRPHLRADAQTSRGRVVIGTVQGDLHDIGKNLVAAMLTSVGYTVTDLGVDVKPESFVEAVKKEKPQVVALSCLLTVGMPNMKATMDALKAAGLRGKVKAIVGGRPVTLEYAKEIGADAFGPDATEALRIIGGWTGGGR